MKRNLNNRVETIVPVRDSRLKRQLDGIIEVYEKDNCSAWDAQPDGSYVRRRPVEGEPARNAQEIFIRKAQRAVRSAVASQAVLHGSSEDPA